MPLQRGKTDYNYHKGLSEVFENAVRFFEPKECLRQHINAVMALFI